MIAVILFILNCIRSIIAATCTCADNCAFGYSDGAGACAIGQLTVLLFACAFVGVAVVFFIISCII